MAKLSIATLTLNFTIQHLVLHMHCILDACLQQKAQATSRFYKEFNKII